MGASRGVGGSRTGATASQADDALGDIPAELMDDAERLSGMAETQQTAFALCSALKNAFGFGGVDSAGEDHPIYPKCHDRAEVTDT